MKKDQNTVIRVDKVIQVKRDQNTKKLKRKKGQHKVIQVKKDQNTVIQVEKEETKIK